MPGSLLAAAVGRAGWGIMSLVRQRKPGDIFVMNSIGSEMTLIKSYHLRFWGI